jgi:hypothetical protein
VHTTVWIDRKVSLRSPLSHGKKSIYYDIRGAKMENYPIDFPASGLYGMRTWKASQNSDLTASYA